MAADPSLTVEDELFAIAGEEVAGQKLVPAIWAKAWSHALGNHREALALYIQFRVEQLKREHRSRKLAQLKECTRRQLNDFSYALVVGMVFVMLVVIGLALIGRFFLTDDRSSAQKPNEGFRGSPTLVGSWRFTNSSNGNRGDYSLTLEFLPDSRLKRTYRYTNGNQMVASGTYALKTGGVEISSGVLGNTQPEFMQIKRLAENGLTLQSIYGVLYEFERD